MRSRTEQVTNTVDGSDYDDDTDFEDSEEDWRPEKGDSKVGLKRKSLDTTPAGGRRGSRNSGVAAKRGRKAVNSTPRRRSARPRRSAGGRKSLPSDDEEENEEEQPDSERNEEEEEDDDDDDGEDSEEDSESQDSPVSSKRGRKSMKNRAASGSTKGSKQQSSRAEATSTPTAKPIQRKVVNMTQSFPDKTGILKLYAFKDDLREGIRENLKLCLWRRDGSSLLQKYFRDKSVDANTPQFTSSMVYSCWEDKRAYEYMEVKVRCIEQSKHLRVQIVDIETVERRAKEEYREFVEKYEKLYATTASENGSTLAEDGNAAAANNADTAGSQGEEEDGACDRAGKQEDNLEMGQDASEEEEEDPPQEE